MDKLKNDMPSFEGGYDKTHYELSIAIVKSLPIDCLSQMKGKCINSKR